MDQLTLIKNKKGRIVSVTPARKKFLLDPNPVALKVNGQPKEDADGRHYPLIKSRDEEGWTDVTAAEYKQYVAELEEAQADAEEVEEATQTAAIALKSAAQLGAQAGKIAAKKTAGRKSNAQKAQEEAAAKEAAEADAKAKEELEIAVRDAEGDFVKYNALSDDGKAMYQDLIGDAPENEQA